MAIIPTTWNPADKGSNVTLGNSDLTANIAYYTNSAVRAVSGKSVGKWYWEWTLSAVVPDSYINTGVWPISRSIGTYIYNTSGVIRITPAQRSVGDVFGFAFDADAGTLAVTRNGAAFSSLTGLSISEPWHPVAGDDNTSGTVSLTANFGQSAFSYAPPAGFFAGIGEQAFALSGVVKDAANAAAARLVRALREDTGAAVGYATSDAVTGAYSIDTPHIGAHTLIAYPAAGENLPALTLRGVVPV